MKTPKYIEVFGKKGEITNAKNLISLDIDTKFGNLELKIMCIAQSIEYINLKIQSVWEKHYNIRNKIFNPIQSTLNSRDIPLMMRDSEVVIYFIKRTVDDMICLIYILDYNFPEKIEIDSIGKLLSNRVDKNLKYLKEEYKDFLTLLNNLANSYKHSFINYDKAYTAMGRDEPCILSVSLQRNNLNNPMEFSSIALNEIVGKSQKFLSDTKEIVAKYKDKKLI